MSGKIKSRRRSDQNIRLTGTPRKLKDSVADLYNAIQKWKTLNNAGFNILSEIANAKITSRTKFAENKHREMQSEFETYYPPEMEQLCIKLNTVYKSMKTLADKIDKIHRHTQKLNEMDANSSFDTGSGTSCPFLQWPVSKFADHITEINEMYQKQIDVKLTVVENIAHADFMPCDQILSLDDTRDLIMTYTSCWLHEPYMNDQRLDLILKELLYETGHK